MARTFPSTVVQAMTAQTTSAVVLTLLDVTHPDWTNVYLVNNTANVTSNGQLYSAFPFSIVLPPDSEELQPTMSIRVVNVTRLLVDEFRAIAGGSARATCTVKLIEASDPDTVLATWSNFTLANLQYNARSMSFDLYLENFLSEPFPSLSFTPSNFPGLF